MASIPSPIVPQPDSCYSWDGTELTYALPEPLFTLEEITEAYD